jgi:hypothetical protein
MMERETGWWPLLPPQAAPIGCQPKRNGQGGGRAGFAGRPQHDYLGRTERSE